MPNHQLFTLTAKQAQTPAEILSYAKPLSPMMRKRVHELARVISDAMKKPITAPAPPPAVVLAPAPVQATTLVGRKLNQSLWEPKSGLLKTAGSGLFGMTLKAKRKEVGAAKKAESSLFGARTKIKSLDVGAKSVSNLLTGSLLPKRNRCSEKSPSAYTHRSFRLLSPSPLHPVRRKLLPSQSRSPSSLPPSANPRTKLSQSG